MSSKICSKCKIEKDISDFYRHKRSGDGYSSSCKECDSKHQKEYYKNNSEIIKKKTAKYYRKHKEKCYKDDRKRLKTIKKERPWYYVWLSLKASFISRGAKSLGISNRAYTRKMGKSSLYINYTAEELKEYIENLFLSGMTWYNYGIHEGNWHLGHILAYSSFDVTNKKDMIECFKLDNLKPDWGYDNISRHNKIEVQDILKIKEENTRLKLENKGLREENKILLRGIKL